MAVHKNKQIFSSKSKIYVAGHKGLVGSAIVRRLRESGYENILGRTHAQLDLCNQKAVSEFFQKEKPDYVFQAAAKVGGIHANNTCPADFIYQNILIQTNIIDAAYRAGVERLLFLGSSCVYPRLCTQPIKEEYLLTGPLEKTNEPYAVAKIAGIKMCESYNRQYGTRYVSVMPTNLYGPNDNFDLETAHVLPALLRKIHEADESGNAQVQIWGSGKPRREFLYVDDLASACIYIMEREDFTDLINIGYGEDISISELAGLIKEIIGYKGEFIFDRTKPDGTPQKLLDISKLKMLGWNASINLQNGIKETYEWYLRNKQYL